MAAFHQTWAYVAVVLCGVAGLWGVGLRLAGRKAGRAFAVGAGAAVASLLLQGAAGLTLYATGMSPGAFHVFYGVVIAVTLAIAYVYKGQLTLRGPFAWGLLLLFLMGLGVRAITTVGQGIG